jgi:hypothetical protein
VKTKHEHIHAFPSAENRWFIFHDNRLIYKIRNERKAGIKEGFA